MSNRKFLRLEGDTVKVLSKGEDVTKLRIMVTAFGSETRKDLHGEFFHPETDFGDDFAIPVKAFYEHGMNDLVNPFMANNRQVVGTAKFAEADDVGRWYDFELQRSHEYHDAILALIEKGYMGASTQCYPNQRSAPTDTGSIDRWLEAEVSITPTPADYETIGKVLKIAKSYGMPDLEIAKSVEKLIEDGLAEVDEEGSLAEEITGMFQGGAEGEAPEPEPDSNTEPEEEIDADEMMKVLKAITTQMEVLTKSIEEIKESTQGFSGVSDTLKSINTRTVQTNKAIRAVAVGIVTNAKSGVPRPLEEDDDTNRQSPKYKSRIPEHAPGG